MLHTSTYVSLFFFACFNLQQDEQQADYLARNGRMDINTGDDPLMHLQALRLHIYRDDRTRESNLQLLERLRLLDELNFFSRQYMELLKLASTPLPFPLVQVSFNINPHYYSKLIVLKRHYF